MYRSFSFSAFRTKTVKDNDRLLERRRGHFKGKDIQIVHSATETHLNSLALGFADLYVPLGYKFSVYLTN